MTEKIYNIMEDLEELRDEYKHRKRIAEKSRDPSKVERWGNRVQGIEDAMGIVAKRIENDDSSSKEEK